MRWTRKQEERKKKHSFQIIQMHKSLFLFASLLPPVLRWFFFFIHDSCFSHLCLILYNIDLMSALSYIDAGVVVHNVRAYHLYSFLVSSYSLFTRTGLQNEKKMILFSLSVMLLTCIRYSLCHFIMLIFLSFPFTHDVMYIDVYDLWMSKWWRYYEN